MLSRRLTRCTSTRTTNLYRLQYPSFRSYATTPSSKPVELQHDAYIPPNKNEKEEPLVILHGFLGSKRNWQSLCKAFVKDLNRPIYALDLRNHGASPHVRPHAYPDMAADVAHFMSSRGLVRPIVLGHSMGGKVAMTLALSDEGKDALSKLVVVDIAPSSGRLSDDFEGYVRAMQEVEATGARSRKDAADVVRKVESDPYVLAFLLTNLETTPEKTVRFRLPLDILAESLEDIGDFPYAPGERTWDGPTLFVKGEKSKFLNRHNIPLAKELFPNMKMETLDTGHWVHAERPHEFMKLMVDFVGKATD